MKRSKKKKPKGRHHHPRFRQRKTQKASSRPRHGGKTGDDGKKIAFEVKVGDRVLVSKYGGTEIKLDGKEYKIFGSDDLVAILN